MIQSESKFLQILSLVFFALLFTLIFTVLGLGLVSVIWNIPFSETSELFQNMTNPESIAPIKLLQLFNSIGLFLAPGLAYFFLFLKGDKKELRIHKTSPLINYGFVLLLFFLFVPAINYSVKLNELLVLPDFLSGVEQWMKDSEENAKEITTLFLQMDSISDLFVNLFLIAFIPAISEELIFRGVLQKIINKNSSNYHIGIWLAAAIFSAIHFQFYGFIPRMLLGAFFGYLLVWSGSLWLPIFAHFVNNAAGVLGAYFYGIDSMENQLEQVGSSEGTELLTLASTALFIVLLIRFKRAQKNPALGGI